MPTLYSSEIISPYASANGKQRKSLPFIFRTTEASCKRRMEDPIVETKNRDQDFMLCLEKPYTCEMSACKIHLCDSLQSRACSGYCWTDDCLLPKQVWLKQACVWATEEWDLCGVENHGVFCTSHTMLTESPTLFPVSLPILPWLMTSVFSFYFPVKIFIFTKDLHPSGEILIWEEW